MVKHDADDAFADFEEKVTDKPKKKLNFFKKDDTSHHSSEEHEIRKKYKAEKDAIKDQYKKEMAQIHAKKMKQAAKEGKMPMHHQFKIERIAYISVIAILVLYIIFDFALFHGGSADSNFEEQIQVERESQAALQDQDEEETETSKEEVEESKDSEKKEEPEPEEEKEEPAKTYSGRVDFVINNIETKVVDEDQDLGQIVEVSFTIQNDKSTTLTPIVNVYAYDSELEETWETRSRGEYKLPAGISPGKYEEGKIELSPKNFRNLNLDKTVRIELNDTKSGFIKADSKTIEIE